jgi:cell division protein FtsI/penicillin-binding protein 2
MGLRTERRRRLLRRTIPVVAICSSAFAAGVVVATRGADPEEALVARFMRAWEKGDYAAMHRDLTDAARRSTALLPFSRAYRRAGETATATATAAGPPRREDGGYVVSTVTRTRIFGTIRAPVRIELDGSGDEAQIAWDQSLVFPGLRRGETLARSTRLPPRATILARDRTVLAKGPDRSSPIPDVARNVVGILGPIQAERREALLRLGFPRDAEVGQNGLERALDLQLAGRPGGELRAGGRVLARSEPQRAKAVRTTVSPRLERTIVAALGTRLGGIVAVQPRTGEVLGFAGIAFSGLQPPGSTFKIITLAGALEAGVAKRSDEYPVQTSTVLSGVELQNANGESCGGTLTQSFAHSCNSVFAPMGAKLGAQRLVAVAERFGFNREPDVPGAATSTIPSPDQIGDELAVGSTAIGQGRVQSSALQMAVVAATIGLRGRRPELTLTLPAVRRAAPTTTVTSPGIGRTIERMMLAVVRNGTGTAAAIEGVRVAGKTGTAELKTTTECEPLPDDPESCPSPADDPTDTDAWFAAYAPAGDGRPRIAVGVMLVQAGAGGETAAPVAREVLLAGLKR